MPFVAKKTGWSGYIMEDGFAAIVGEKKNEPKESSELKELKRITKLLKKIYEVVRC